ncbi:MAG: M24 family metallopeptidase [Chloroflexota bacterium]
MSAYEAIPEAREYLARHDIKGWLIYDYQQSNPALWSLLGEAPNVTRPCWLWIPTTGRPTLLDHSVDAGRFADALDAARSHGVAIEESRYSSRAQMLEALSGLLGDGGRVAMEYSPYAELPRVARVDAGAVELVRSMGVEVVSSGDVMQYATERWTPAQLASHREAMDGLVRTVRAAFDFISENINWRITEHDVAEFIRGRYERLGLHAPEGPVVAMNAHASDPHYEPRPDTASVIRKNSLVLIDLWARPKRDDGVFADITWTAFVGESPRPEHERVFGAVREARDTAVTMMEDAFEQGRALQGWELDRAAREVIARHGYGEYFVHRLGHSLGRDVHSNAVNLDDWETHDTRTLIPGLAVTVEPGVYLPEFGIRSEIDVYIGEDGPEVTGEVQQELTRVTY